MKSSKETLQLEFDLYGLNVIDKVKADFVNAIRHGSLAAICNQQNTVRYFIDKCANR